MKQSLPRIVSGLRPSGKIHVGNYLGALQNFLALQEQGHDCFFFVADFHTLLDNYDPAIKAQETRDLFIDFLALGLDPKRCTLFVQSHIPEHTELSWAFTCLTPVAELERMTQFKDKSTSQQNNINAGLLCYPVLQAADILMYHPYQVPVGEDQVQHVELTRIVAKKFNKRFGETFPLPQALLTDAPRVKSLLDPTKKMGKSLGDNHCLYVNDSPETIMKKLSKAVTDTSGMAPGVENLFLLMHHFSSGETEKYFKQELKAGQIKFSEMKKQLAEDIAAFFADYRQRRLLLEKDPSTVNAAITAGAAKARVIATATMTDVRKKLGLLLPHSK